MQKIVKNINKHVYFESIDTHCYFLKPFFICMQQQDVAVHLQR